MMKLRRTLMVSRKLFWSLKHDRRSLALIIIAPIMAMFIFGLAFSGEVEDVEVIIVNKDLGAGMPNNNTIKFSEIVIDNIDPDKLIIRYEDDISDAVDQVEEGDANSVIIFPENFTRDLVAFSQGEMYSNISSIEIRSDQSQVTVSQEVVTEVMEAMRETTSQQGFKNPVSVDSSDPIYGKGAQFLDMFVPGIMGFVVFLLTTILTLISFVGEKTRGTLQRLLASSVTETEIVVGYAISFSIIGMVQVGILMVLAILVFGIMVEGNPLLAFLIASILAVVSVCLGILLSSLARRESQAIQFFPLIVLPGFLLSGVFWPIEAMPVWLRPVSYIVPVTYAVDGLRSVLLRGWGVLDIWMDLAMLMLFAVAFLFLAILTLRKTSRG
jgi:ABC-2 type transport system permease protein